ncbi:MAG: SPOR domain-containing protein [Thiobacillaceae bacterium]|jgi:DedD protein
MAVQVAEEDFKRRARRRLMGAVALTILAVIILPLVLDKEPPPTGPLNIEMPPSVQTGPAASEPAPAAEAADQSLKKPEDGETKPAAVDKQSVEPPPAPRTAEKASDHNVEFAVQVGAFADAANVNRIKSRIKSLGLPAYTDKLDNTTRVRAGPFKDRATAEKAAAKLAAAGLPAKLEGP